jgi:antimicrobial peptide system SdpB family protein
MLTKLGARVRRSVDTFDPFTNVYGVGRSLVALSTLLTLVFSRTDVLFRPAAGIDQVPVCMGVRALGTFCVGAPHLDLVRWLSVIVLALVVSGWRPRYTGVLHAWVAFGFQANAITIEGGDQVGAIVALLLVPVTLLDDRRWHWLPRTARAPGERDRTMRLVARVCLFLIRLQVAGIYFHAAIAKFAVPEWTDGTVLYYWLNHASFGAPEWVMPVLRPLLLNGVVVATSTWTVLVVEYALSAGLLVARKHWPVLLVLGIGLHAGIALLHGLVSFGITMFGALVLYLRPIEQPFELARAKAAAVRLRDAIRVRLARTPMHA